MKKVFCILLLLAGVACIIPAQNRLEFVHDASGNRTRRVVPTLSMSEPSGEKNNIHSEYVLGYNITIQPNPKENELTIDISGKKTQSEIEVFLYDTDGNSMFRKKVASFPFTLNLTGEKATCRLLQVKIDNQPLSWEII